MVMLVVWVGRRETKNSAVVVPEDWGRMFALQGAPKNSVKISRDFRFLQETLDS